MPAVLLRASFRALAPSLRELVTFDFTDAPPKVMLSLWPAADKTRSRETNQLEESVAGSLLIEKSTGDDPGLTWSFEQDVASGMLRAEVDSDRDGVLQAFWLTASCPEFSEPCSSVRPIVRGRQVVFFILTSGEPLKKLRFDTVGARGSRLEIHSLQLLERPHLKAEAKAREGFDAAPSAGGLVVMAPGADPWVEVITPSLSAERASRIELELDAPPQSIPQLFWKNETCPDWVERCSVLLESLVGDRFSASLGPAKHWTGNVTGLRLDPGDHPGRYTIKRFALVRASS